MKARTAALILVAIVVLVTLIDLASLDLQNPSPLREGDSSATAAKRISAATASRLAQSDRSTPARRDSAGLSREKQEAAARLAGRITDYIRSIDTTQSVTIDPPHEVMEALARLDANQHRLVMTALCQDASLDPFLRALIGGNISIQWLKAQGERPGRAACASALATLDLLKIDHGALKNSAMQLVLNPLYCVAGAEPDLAARWFADHAALFDRPGQYPDLEGSRAQLLQYMAVQPAAALAQIDALTPQDRGAMYVAIAKGGSHSDNLTETADAFQDAVRTAPDPATAALISQSLAIGLAERFRTLPPAQAIAWMEEDHLPAGDQRALFDHLTLFRSSATTAQWLAWAQGRIPDEAIAAKTASLIEPRRRPAPAPAGQASGK